MVNKTLFNFLKVSQLFGTFGEKCSIEVMTALSFASITLILIWTNPLKTDTNLLIRAKHVEEIQSLFGICNKTTG